MSLFGIETEEDCRQKLDELLELHSLAEKTPTKETVATVKNALKAYFDKGNGGKDQMSKVESTWFWPAIHEAFVKAPNPINRSTWHDGLYEIRLNLTSYRP